MFRCFSIYIYSTPNINIFASLKHHLYCKEGFTCSKANTKSEFNLSDVRRTFFVDTDMNYCVETLQLIKLIIPQPAQDCVLDNFGRVRKVDILRQSSCITLRISPGILSGPSVLPLFAILIVYWTSELVIVWAFCIYKCCSFGGHHWIDLRCNSVTHFSLKVLCRDPLLFSVSAFVSNGYVKISVYLKILYFSHSSSSRDSRPGVGFSLGVPCSF